METKHNAIDFKIPTADKLWQYIVDTGRAVEKGYTANEFNSDDIATITATMEFFNATEIWLKQTLWDLTVPKYRLFDWLAMCVMSRNNDDRKQNEQALKVLVYAWLKTRGKPIDFIYDLRTTDYDINTAWDTVDIND